MNSIFNSLSLLKPYEIDVRKIRLGPAGDGGYVFADLIRPGQTILSYGVDTEYAFDAEMAAQGLKVYMFDHTIEGIVVTHDNMMWVKEGVAGKTSVQDSLYSIQDHLARNNIHGNDLILKMDVEGAEFAALAETPIEVLSRFEQIAVEVHFLTRLVDPVYRAAFDKTFTHVNQAFTLFHVHANNCDTHNNIYIRDGFPMTELIELSFVRSDLVSRSPNRTLYPTVLDYPNVREHKDKLLWFYPFIPTTATTADFAACSERVDLLHKTTGSAARSPSC